jgi:hypothetical protein
MEELGWKDEHQELLSEAGITRMSKTLNLKYSKVRQSYIKLQNKELVKRVVNEYYPGNIFRFDCKRRKFIRIF